MTDRGRTPDFAVLQAGIRDQRQSAKDVERVIQVGAGADRKPAMDGDRGKPPLFDSSVDSERVGTHDRIIDFVSLYPPQSAIENLDDNVPFLLTPVRVEFRFKKVAGAQQLRVRILPDTIQVDNFDETLSHGEVEAAEAFWTEVWRAGGDSARELGAWRVLVAAHGPQRSVWIANAHAPTNERDGSGASNRPAAPLAADAPLATPPAFPATASQPGSWSRAARAMGMPDQFVAIGYVAGNKVFEVAGAAIPDPLIVGPDPLADPDSAPPLDAELKWMADFDEAVRVGMGIRVPLPAAASAGLDRLVVIGIKASATAAEGAEIVEHMIRSHRYSTSGFSLLRQGTPTNNTREAGSGLSSVEENDAERYDREFRRAPWAPGTDWRTRVDGQYLAEALGIDPAVLARAENADGVDQRDAHAANVALWPATMGAFLTEMMDPLLDDATIESVRRFFVEQVSGRGPVPAIRTGRQPYGIVVTSALSRWTYPRATGREPPHGQQETSPAHAIEEATRFVADLHSLLMTFDGIWDSLVGQVAYVGKPGDAQANLLDVLGLHPRSVEFRQRFVASLDQLQDMAILGNQQALADKLTLKMKQASDQALAELSIASADFPAIYQKIFFNEAPLIAEPLIDALPPSETRALAPISEDRENYLQWIASNDFDTIRREDFGQDADGAIAPPTALAYQLLRLSALNVFYATTARFYSSAGLGAMAPRSDPALMNIRAGGRSNTRIGAMYSPAGRLAESYPRVFADAGRSVAEQMAPRNLVGLPESALLFEFREAVALLADRPTAVLVRAVTESIDTCSFRLGAWQTAVVRERLWKLRSGGAGGIHIGAYGYLEKLSPGAPIAAFTGSAPAAFTGAVGTDLYTQPGNGGYIHAPSLNHGVAAAILRSGYMTHRTGANPPLQIDLSSDRVRRAMFILEGVSKGQGLGALLGYQLERQIHEDHGLAEIDRFIYALRAKFPLVAGQITVPPGGTAIQQVEARNVVDGLKLVRHVQSSGLRQYPFGIAALAALDPVSNAQKAALNAEIARIEETLDAVADLVMSESVYAAARSNFERAGAALDSISGGPAYVDPQIVRPPRSAYVLTHRFCLHLPAVETYAGVNPYDGTIPLTPRAALEPGLNAWLASIFGDLGNIVCPVVTRAEGQQVLNLVSIADLGLQPIDLLYIAEPRSPASAGEFDSRIAYARRARGHLPGPVQLALEYTRPVAGKLTLFEVLPLIRALKGLCLGSRPLRGNDLTPSSQQIGDPPVAGNLHNPNGWNVSALRARIHAVLATAMDLVAALAAAAADAASVDLSVLRPLLIAAANHGIGSAVPATATEQDPATAATLVAQALAAAAALQARIDAAFARYNEPAGLDADIEVERMGAVAKALFGPDFVLVPTFAIADPADLSAALMDREAILRHVATKHPFPLETWLATIAKVRDKPACFERILILAEALGLSQPEFFATQLPYRADDYWLGMDFPPQCTPGGDRLLLMSIFGGDFSSPHPQAGLLIDEFTDSVPVRDQTTALAFNIDVPASQPPQALLLAVAPELSGSWKWDDLVATITETMDMAKKRAVEPRHLAQSELAQLLPAILQPVSHGPPAMTTDPWSISQTRPDLQTQTSSK